MHRGIVIAALAGGFAAAAAPAASAAPCTLTGVALEDRSPSKDAGDRALRRGATKNVGQEIRMGTQLSGPRPTGDRVSFRWTVGGDAIRNYTDVTPITVQFRPKAGPCAHGPTFAPVAFNVTPADRTDGGGNSVFDSDDGVLQLLLAPGGRRAAARERPGHGPGARAARRRRWRPTSAPA